MIIQEGGCDERLLGKANEAQTAVKYLSKVNRRTVPEATVVINNGKFFVVKRRPTAVCNRPFYLFLVASNSLD